MKFVTSKASSTFFSFLVVVCAALGTAVSALGSTVATPTFSPAPGTYGSAQTVTISTATAGATIYFTSNGNAPTPSSIKYAGPIKVGATVTIKAYATAAGMTDSAEADATYTISPLPIITSATTATGAVGTAFSYSIVALNNPTNLTAAGLPAGLSFSYATDGNTISGTPAVGGQFGILITATNSAGYWQIVLTLTVSGGAGAPVVISPPLGAGVVNTPFWYGFSAKGALPITFTVTGSLPPGLSLTSNGNAISGTPTTVGTTTVTLTATNSSGVSMAKSVTIGIGAGPSLPLVIPAGNPTTKTKGNSLSDAYKDVLMTSGSGVDKSTWIAATSSVSIKLTIPLDAISDFSTIDKSTKFNLVAGKYQIGFALGDAPSTGPNGKGGKLNIKSDGSGTATYLEVLSADVTMAEVTRDASLTKDLKYGTVTLKWDKKKKLLTVTVAEAIGKVASDWLPTSNIICAEGDNNTISADVDVEVYFGDAYAFLTAHMAGKGTTIEKIIGKGANAYDVGPMTTSSAKSASVTPAPPSQ
ncbi:MAG: chitobiase/beta-hexosaminidase C-terminal domain-containing protein [Planctomycetota bacterium]